MPRRNIWLSIFICLGLAVWANACDDGDDDTGGDTDTDTDTDVCEYLHDLVQSLCGPVLPQMIECCQTQWDEILDMDVMVECIENASDCYDVMDCDTLAAYCHPGDCPAALLDCPGFTGDPWQIYDAWLCASWLMSSEYSPYWLRICDLGECVPEHVITYELCGPDGFEVCEGGLADPDNGLCWQNAPDPELRSWFEASEHCEGLTLEGYDDWRLPTVGELRTLIQGWPNTETDGPCGVSDECYELSCWSYSDCDGGGYLDGPGNSGCYWSPALSGYCHRYWTQSLFEASGVKAWYVDFNSGAIDFDAQSADQAVRCVRVLD